MIGLPDHLQHDAPYVQCVRCGRKTWNTIERLWPCNMPQPNREICGGRLVAPDGSVTAANE
jgi:hypothetical protein